MPFYFRNPPDPVARAAGRFRDDIVGNRFMISQQEEDRLARRGTAQNKVMETVERGLPCALPTSYLKDNWMVCGFHYKNLVCVFAAPFGDMTAWPILVATFLETDEATIPVDWSAIEPRKREQDRGTVIRLSDFSIAELECMLARKKSILDLREKLANIIAQIESLSDQRRDVLKEIQALETIDLQPAPAPLDSPHPV